MSDKPDYLQGVIDRLTFYSPETGYTVARLQSPGIKEPVTIVGNFANIQAGQNLEGIWHSHPKYGEQFKVTQYQRPVDKIRWS